MSVSLFVVKKICIRSILKDTKNVVAFAKYPTNFLILFTGDEQYFKILTACLSTSDGNPPAATPNNRPLASTTSPHPPLRDHGQDYIN